MIIALDGPAGAGKSTTARAVAEHFGYAYIDTGAMYRAVALAAAENGFRIGENDAEISALAGSLPLRLEENGKRMFIGSRDVSDAIRTPEISALTSAVSAIAPLREIIVEMQRRLAREGEATCGGAILEGRDIQTVVFPDAPVKVFLTADAKTRAGRRAAQWNGAAQQNIAADAASQQVAERDIIERDERDMSREASPLRAAPDAVHIATDSLSTDEIVAQIAQLVAQCQEQQ